MANQSSHDARKSSDAFASQPTKALASVSITSIARWSLKISVGCSVRNLDSFIADAEATSSNIGSLQS